MNVASYAVILRLRDSIGLAEWCATIDPSAGRPDLSPEKPWDEMAAGDVVTTADGTVYEVVRLSSVEDEDSPAVPGPGGLIERAAGLSHLECLPAHPR